MRPRSVVLLITLAGAGSNCVAGPGSGAAQPEPTQGGANPQAPLAVARELWLDTFPGQFGAAVDSIAVAPDATIFATVRDDLSLMWQGPGRPPGTDHFSLVRVDIDGAATELARFTRSGCDVYGTLTGVTTDGLVLAQVGSTCVDPIPGLGPTPIGPQAYFDGALIALDRNGNFVRRIANNEFYQAGVVADGSLVGIAKGFTVVQRLSLDGEVRWRADVAARYGKPAAASAPTAAGGATVVLDPETAGSLVVRYSPNGTEEWARRLPGLFSVGHVAQLTDGAVAVTGDVPVDSDGNPAATTTGHLGITVLEGDGSVRGIVGVIDANPFDVALFPVALADGRVAVLVQGGRAKVTAFSRDLRAISERQLDVPSWSTVLDGARAGDHLVFAGSMPVNTEPPAGFLEAVQP